MIKKSLLIMGILAFAQADVVTFNNGAVLNGVVTQQDAQTLTIKVDAKETRYSKSDIKTIEIEQGISAPPAPPSVAVVEKKSEQSSSGLIEAGTILHIATTELISSAKHSKGHQFRMRLESNVLDKNSKVIVEKGSDVYGVVVESQQAGRLIGESKMLISLSAISIDGKRIPIKTDAINILAPKKQARDTTSKVARGAILGGLINGSDGAKDGAKVGVGLALLTRGKATGVPAGTLLDFTLTTNVKIN
jgi:hypothetical protein